MQSTAIVLKLMLLLWWLIGVPLAAQETTGNVEAGQDSIPNASPALSLSGSFPYTVRLLTSDYLRHSPYRTLPALLVVEPGIVLQDGELHIRGSRPGQIVYFLDGATVTNPYFNSSNVPFIPEAVEEIQLHTGAYTAEYGGGLAALVRTQLRTGGDHFEVTADYRTDDFAEPGAQFLGTSAFGLRNAVVTLGGPLFSKLRYFVAGQHYYLRDQGIRFLEPFRFDSLKTDRPGGQPLPGPIAFERNYVPHNFYQENAVQGTLGYDLNEAINFRFTGSFADIQTPADAAWPIPTPRSTHSLETIRAVLEAACILPLKSLRAGCCKAAHRRSAGPCANMKSMPLPMPWFFYTALMGRHHGHFRTKRNVAFSWRAPA